MHNKAINKQNITNTTNNMHKIYDGGVGRLFFTHNIAIGQYWLKWFLYSYFRSLLVKNIQAVAITTTDYCC